MSEPRMHSGPSVTWFVIADDAFDDLAIVLGPSAISDGAWSRTSLVNLIHTAASRRSTDRDELRALEAEAESLQPPGGDQAVREALNRLIAAYRAQADGRVPLPEDRTEGPDGYVQLSKGYFERQRQLQLAVDTARRSLIRARERRDRLRQGDSDGSPEEV